MVRCEPSHRFHTAEMNRTMEPYKKQNKMLMNIINAAEKEYFEIQLKQIAFMHMQKTIRDRTKSISFPDYFF